MQLLRYVYVYVNSVDSVRIHGSSDGRRSGGNSQPCSDLAF